jgi:hypothetical protein
MKELLFTLVLLMLLIAVALGGTKRRSLRNAMFDGPWPYYAKRPMSRPEQVLYHRLTAALPDHIVLAQVQVSRILGVKRGFNFQVWNNRINRMSYDFVVCSSDSTVLAAIELDDSSHDSRARAVTDRKKEKATRDAGVRLLRWNVNALPDHAAIRTAVDEPPPTRGDAGRSRGAPPAHATVQG